MPELNEQPSPCQTSYDQTYDKLEKFTQTFDQFLPQILHEKKSPRFLRLHFAKSSNLSEIQNKTAKHQYCAMSFPIFSTLLSTQL